VQEKFEVSSTLGELESIFDELRDGAASVSWESFLQNCRGDSMRSRAHSAIGLLPREHVTGAKFEATNEWAEVPDGAACPAGLEYKMDMTTGKTLARVAPPKIGD